MPASHAWVRVRFADPSHHGALREAGFQAAPDRVLTWTLARFVPAAEAEVVMDQARRAAPTAHVDAVAAYDCQVHPGEPGSMVLDDGRLEPAHTTCVPLVVEVDPEEVRARMEHRRRAADLDDPWTKDARDGLPRMERY